MMRAQVSLLALFCLVFSTTNSYAENQFCVGGETSTLTAAQRKSCNEQVQAARLLVGRTHVQNWHFIVVCGEANWSDYSSFAHNDPNALAEAVVDTVYEDRTTFLRGEKLGNPASPAYTRLLSAISVLETPIVAEARNMR